LISVATLFILALGEQVNTPKKPLFRVTHSLSGGQGGGLAVPELPAAGIKYQFFIPAG
jgi:hypothetical protein